MRMTIDIDCTPEEARQLVGLPDITPVNDMIVKEMTRQAKDKIETLADPERLLSHWMNAGGKGLEQFQQMVGAAIAGTANRTSSGTANKPPKSGK